jgi:eukaryotic-like serine/threonine-protein kinase
VVKVLDFGLAKGGAGHTVSDNLIQSREGLLVGTASYMSPEQARGRPVDKRTDIWAFGCVLFEMLTGRRAFAGETISDTISAILEREPDWRALPDRTPPAVQRLLQRCLSKDPGRRLRDAGDVRIEIDDAMRVRSPIEELPGRR